MMRLDKTINYYNTYAKEFFDKTKDANMSHCLHAFLEHLEPGAYILDAGCGSGRDSRYFLEHGYKILSIDASEEICKLAEEYLSHPVQCMKFEELEYETIFDGIWACASLLHVERKKLPVVMQKLYNALKENGVLYASFKYGNEEVIRDERLFNNYNESELEKLLKGNTCFTILELFETSDVRAERAYERWINVIAQKPK